VIYLLDVNVLLAMGYEEHDLHARATSEAVRRRTQFPPSPSPH
jgi:hypothetical protein